MPLRVGLILFALVLLGVSGAQAIGITQSLDKADIAYEDRANLEIVVTWTGSQTSYIFDKPLQPPLENLKVQQYSSTVSSTGSGASEITTKRFTFALMPTGPGIGKVSPVTVSYYSWPDSIPGQLVTEEMTLHIASPIAKKKTTGGAVPLWIWIAGAAVTLIGAAIVVVLLIRRRTPKEIVRSPQELMLDRLTALKQASGSDLKKFQTGLYKDLVWYATEAYKLELGGLSTDELIEKIQAAKVPEAEKSTICGWIARAEREKFSPLPPSPGETTRLEHEVREFFEKMIVRS
jgi:hypothetical protein